MTPSTTSSLTIVALGDSITACSAEAEQWTKMVERGLAERFERDKLVVINAGVGGNTSREGLARMDRDVMVHAPDYVLVEFGGNDATDDPSRFVPLWEFCSNLVTMKARLDAAGRGEMILLTFPPIIDENHAWRDREFYRDAGGPDLFIETYREATRDIARREGLALVDVDLAIRANPSSNILPDGVHLAMPGVRAVADAVLPILVGRIEERVAAAKQS